MNKRMAVRAAVSLGLIIVFGAYSLAQSGSDEEQKDNAAAEAAKAPKVEKAKAPAKPLSSAVRSAAEANATKLLELYAANMSSSPEPEDATLDAAAVKAAAGLRVFVRDEAPAAVGAAQQRWRLAVVKDRAQAASSQQDGALELMLHRRVNVTTTYVPVNDTSRVNVTSRLIVLPDPAEPEAGGMTAPRAMRTATRSATTTGCCWARRMGMPWAPRLCTCR